MKLKVGGGGRSAHCTGPNSPAQALAGRIHGGYRE